MDLNFIEALGTFYEKLKAEINSKLSGKVDASHTHNYAGSSSAGGAATTALACTGNAATATKLATARTVRTNLESTSTASFNGTANITPGVTGVLPIANGGTGNTSNDAATVSGHTVQSNVPANAKFTDTTYGSASSSSSGLVSTGTQTFAGSKTFNGSVYPNGASSCSTAQARKLASGTAAATTSNCPAGAWYGQYE